VLISITQRKWAVAGASAAEAPLAIFYKQILGWALVAVFGRATGTHQVLFKRTRTDLCAIAWDFTAFIT
jgi:hypothetical protein